MSGVLLEADELTVEYQTRGKAVTAASDVSFTIEEGEYFGLIGESGCGKSTIVRAILGALDDNGRIASGEIRYKGQDLASMSDPELNEAIRWEEISWIPQGSMSTLDPLMRISRQATEIANAHTDWSEKKTISELQEMFEIVGLPPERVNDYPHQFSGGMQQRALIALALFLKPSLIVADEPTTALDVIMQDEIFDYLDQIKEQTDTSLMLITHDISLVFESCDTMAVMHAGQISEVGTTTDVYDSPRHPYASLLQRAFPDVRYPDRKLEVIEGNPPQNRGEVDYCTFVERCPWATEECSASAPELDSVTDGGEGHQAACFHKEELYEKDAINQYRAKPSTNQ